MRSNPDTARDRLTEERAWLERLARRLVHDPDEAADVAQEALAIGLATAPRGPAARRGWLGQIARNAVRMRHRSRTRRARREEAWAPADAAPDPVAALHVERTRKLVTVALAELAEPYRTAVRLRHIEDRSLAEIAAAQGIPIGTAGWRVSQGLKHLRARLDRET